MKKAYIHLIDYALSQGHTISVWDDEEWSTQRSTDRKEILEDIDGLEEAQIVIRNAEGERLAWALVVPYDVGPDETVADYSDNQYMAQWFSQYEREEIIP